MRRRMCECTYVFDWEKRMAKSTWWAKFEPQAYLLAVAFVWFIFEMGKLEISLTCNLQLEWVSNSFVWIFVFLSVLERNTSYICHALRSVWPSCIDIWKCKHIQREREKETELSEYWNEYYLVPIILFQNIKYLVQVGWLRAHFWYIMCWNNLYEVQKSQIYSTIAFSLQLQSYSLVPMLPFEFRIGNACVSHIKDPCVFHLSLRTCIALNIFRINYLSCTLLVAL